MTAAREILFLTGKGIDKGLLWEMAVKPKASWSSLDLMGFFLEFSSRATVDSNSPTSGFWRW